MVIIVLFFIFIVKKINKSLNRIYKIYIMNEYPIIKIVVIGEAGIGKSSMSEVYIKNKAIKKEYEHTIGIEFYSKIFDYKRRKYHVFIWDTAGQERFRSITKCYYRDAMGALICFDVANRKTFELVQRYIKDLKNFSPKNISKILVGTCCDKENREIEYDEANNYALEQGLKYYETSSKTNKNINQVFTDIINNVCNKIEIGDIVLDNTSKLSEKESYLSCCVIS